MNPWGDTIARLRELRQIARRLDEATFACQTALVALREEPDCPLTRAVYETAVEQADNALACHAEWVV